MRNQLMEVFCMIHVKEVKLDKEASSTSYSELSDTTLHFLQQQWEEIHMLFFTSKTTRIDRDFRENCQEPTNKNKKTDKQIDSVALIETLAQ